MNGGTEGNQQLTAQLGVILLVLLAALGVTIPDLRLLIWEHLFLGFLLLGPVLAKLGSTGYRFVRYYTRDPAYRTKGPPELYLRAIGPIVVLSTFVVFISGVLLLIEGPGHRNPSLTIHKLGFIVWVVFMAVHVLGHLRELPHSLRAARETRAAVPGLSAAAGSVSGPGRRAVGAGGRSLTLAGSMVAGLIVALVLIPDFSSWTAKGVFRHHRHRHEAAAAAHRYFAYSMARDSRITVTLI
jgi:hypothetical protein